MMKSALSIAVIAVMLASAESNNSSKKNALAAVKNFFPIAEQKKEYDGHYVDTLDAYGKNCKIMVDFSRPGHESISLRGEYTPLTSVGDGIFFNAADESFSDFVSSTNSITIEQRIRDGFSTWTETTLILSKSQHGIELRLNKTSSFLLFTDSVEKLCIAPWSKST